VHTVAPVEHQSPKFAEGKHVLCLFTDLANPYSNRCYAKIGFERVRIFYHCFRKPNGGSAAWAITSACVQVFGRWE
jgi:hypothetical protein